MANIVNGDRIVLLTPPNVAEDSFLEAIQQLVGPESLIWWTVQADGEDVNGWDRWLLEPTASDPG